MVHLRPFTSLLLLSLFIYVAFSSPLKVSQDDFSMQQTYDQLMLSYAAYCPAAQLMNWSCIFCMNNTAVETFTPVATVYNATTDIFGYVGYWGKVAVVVFRGTHFSSLLNWIDDLNFAHVTPYKDIPNAFVHAGFLDSWLSVKAQVLIALKTVYTKITPTGFYFTGHSLGAAISVLSAIDLTETLALDVPVTCYNYGEPRVGNSGFATYFNSKIGTTYRIINQHDIVPHLPTKALGFWHFTQEVWWVNSTTHVICSETNGEDPACSDSLTVALSVPDHLDYLGVPLHLGKASGCL